MHDGSAGREGRRGKASRLPARQERRGAARREEVAAAVRAAARAEAGGHPMLELPQSGVELPNVNSITLLFCCSLNNRTTIRKLNNT